MIFQKEADTEINGTLYINLIGFMCFYAVGDGGSMRGYHLVHRYPLVRAAGGATASAARGLGISALLGITEATKF